jgi:hypothetical protein
MEARSMFPQNYFLLKNIPGGVININYDIHACVHMGTQLEATETVYPPTAIRLTHRSCICACNDTQKVTYGVIISRQG